MATDIGTATMTDVSTAVMPPLNALDVELANHTAGISEINAMNQPAPNGKGKYSVQTEFGTVFENRNWLGSSIIATQRKIMLIIIVAIFRFTLFLPCMANARNTGLGVLATFLRHAKKVTTCPIPRACAG
jgi:hypothetical protein